jgi:DNA polymerase-3 subunit delta'
MSGWQMVGQSRAISLLQRSLKRGSIAHAYLVVGPPHVGKMTLAINLAQALNCEATEPPCGACPSCQKIDQGKHADVQIIGLASIDDANGARSRTEISIDQIRQLQHSANLPPFEGRCKVFIIDRAELLSTEAANCFLKTLEEPVGQVVFVLLTTSSSLLPETVVSRCQRLELLPVAASEAETALVTRWGVEPQKARLLARLSHGCFGWALSAALGANLLTQYYGRRDRLLDIINSNREERFNYAAQLAIQFSQERDSVQEILALWLDFWRDLLLIKVAFSQAITNIDLEDTLTRWAGSFSPAEVRAFISSIQAAKEQLRQNANPRLVLEVLMLDMPRRKVEGVIR